MNLRIGICDDVKEYRDDLKRFVTEYYKEKNMSDNDAMKQVAKDRNVSKNVIYKEIKC